LQALEPVLNLEKRRKMMYTHLKKGGNKMRQSYPSDITRGQFEIMRIILESAQKMTRPREVDLYEIFCAILYIVKEGCTWRGLPHDFPRWGRAYDYFRIWGEESDSGKSYFEQALQELVIAERVLKGREAQTSMVIVDSKSIKNTDLPEEKGYDAGKKLQGSRYIWE
jgi:transposase